MFTQDSSGKTPRLIIHQTNPKPAIQPMIRLISPLMENADQLLKKSHTISAKEFPVLTLKVKV